MFRDIRQEWRSEEGTHQGHPPAFCPQERYKQAKRLLEMAAKERIYTLANGLSAARLLSALPCVYAVAISSWSVAAAVFVFAVATDMIDGPLARRRGEASRTGGLIDHSADALFCIAVFAALASTGVYPVLLPFMIAAAFVQYVIDSRVFAGKELRASRIGRYNGIAYFVLAGAPIARNLMGWSWPSDAVLQGLGWVFVATTAVSMIDRLRARVTGR